jgi:hypothetical protein
MVYFKKISRSQSFYSVAQLILAHVEAGNLADETPFHGDLIAVARCYQDASNLHQPGLIVSEYPSLAA